MVLHLAAVIWFAVELPSDAKVPFHWNIKNEIDGWTGKTFGLWWGIGINFVMFLLIYLMHWYSPWYKKYSERFEKVLPALTLTLITCFSVLSLYSLAIAKWGDLQGMNIIMVLIGLLFIFLGNLLPKVPKNFFVGIRTPWTLADESVWDRTHRLGGMLYVIAGVLMLVKGFLLAGNSVFQIGSAIIALALLLYPLVYSFIIYKKLGKA
jgi:uncharacterized membrane protein